MIELAFNPLQNGRFLIAAEFLDVPLIEGNPSAVYIQAPFNGTVNLSSYKLMIVPFLRDDSKMQVQVYLYSHNETSQKSGYIFYTLPSSSLGWGTWVFNLRVPDGSSTESFNQSSVSKVMICFINGSPAHKYFGQIEFVSP